MNPNRDSLGEKQLVTHKEAARRLFRDRQFACSIPLALSADGQLPEGDRPSVFAIVNDRAAAPGQNLNTVRNWLKHHRPPNERPIHELEVVPSQNVT